MGNITKRFRGNIQAQPQQRAVYLAPQAQQQYRPPVTQISQQVPQRYVSPIAQMSQQVLQRYGSPVAQMSQQLPQRYGSPIAQMSQQLLQRYGSSVAQMSQQVPQRYGSPVGQISQQVPYGYRPSYSNGYSMPRYSGPPPLSSSYETDILLSKIVGLPPEKIGPLRVEFFDYANSNGVIDREGFRKIFIASLLDMAWAAIERDAEVAFHNFDINKTGELDFNEYMIACSRTIKGN